MVSRHLGFLPADVLARSLRASGATALLVARVDTDIIQNSTVRTLEFGQHATIPPCLC